jgi:hypothetical protein
MVSFEGTLFHKAYYPGGSAAARLASEQLPWCRSRWMSGPALDLGPGGDGDLGGMWHLVPPGTCLAIVEDLALHAADAHQTSGPAR